MLSYEKAAGKKLLLEIDTISQFCYDFPSSLLQFFAKKLQTQIVTTKKNTFV